MLTSVYRRCLSNVTHQAKILNRSLSTKNEPILNFELNSKERLDVEEALKEVETHTRCIPIVIGGEEHFPNDIRYQCSPYRHNQKIAQYPYASPELINAAIENSLSARKDWALKPQTDRAQIFLKAADVLANEKRATILAATMAGQAKTVIQAEIDAGPELIDFFRFNAEYAMQLEKAQPLSPESDIHNSVEYRGLEGFIAAVSPFNFTAIGGNLAGTPAMMGNVVLWKPSDTAMLSSWIIYETLRECGLPPGVIQFLPSDGPTFGNTVTASEHFAGLNFTGSVPTFTKLWQQVAENLPKYRTFPRMNGECGGKNYHLVHPSANVDRVVYGSIRSAFEFGGQKCSACSRAYIPASLWPQVKEKLVECHSQIKMGEPGDMSVFLSSVIDKTSFLRIQKYQEYARDSDCVEVIAGGGSDGTCGYYIEPTIVQVQDPEDKLMQEEIFGPVLAVYVYEDCEYKNMLELVNNTSDYALTGSIFADDEEVVQEAKAYLRDSAGNFYINDKSTGSVVAQQWFGGARKSGTNDKPGGPHYVLRWVSPQATKRNTGAPPTDFKYPSMDSCN